MRLSTACFWEQERIIWLELLERRLSLAVNVEGQMGRFVAKTLCVYSRLVVLTYWTSGQELLLTVASKFGSQLVLKLDSQVRSSIRKPEARFIARFTCPKLDL